MKVRVGKAACYAVIGFQTAYLMRYYKAEFIAAMLNSVMGINEKVAYYIRFAESEGIQVLPPDINESFAKFTVKDETTIRFGLASIKNAGLNVIESIVRSREAKGKFTSLYDFCNKVDLGVLNKRVIESLIKAGALDVFKAHRSQMLAVYEKLLDGINSERKRNIAGQVSLFGEIEDSALSVTAVVYPNIKEFEKRYLLAMEKEMTGLYLSGHPLDEYEATLEARCSNNIGEIMMSAASSQVLDDGLDGINSEVLDSMASTRRSSDIVDGSRVILGGIISDISKKFTKNNDMMAFITLEDLYGSIETIVFPKVYVKASSLLVTDGIILVKGRISIREEEAPKLICEDIEPLVKIDSSSVYVLVEDNNIARQINKNFKEILLKFRGSTPVYLCTKKERAKYRMDRNYWIDLQSDVIEFLKSQFGEDKVKVVTE